MVDQGHLIPLPTLHVYTKFHNTIPHMWILSEPEST